MTTGLIDPTALARLDQIAVLTDPDRSIQVLPGGLTNQNFKVVTGHGTFVARLSGESSTLLSIDRVAEHDNCLAAASTGVAPEVVDYRPELGALVVRWITGRTLSESDIRDPAMLAQVATACRALHGAPRFSSDFDMFALQQRYLRTVLDRGFRLPDRYIDFMPAVDRIRTVLHMSAPAPVPCHNDLLAENFIAAPDQLWIIDYEYSGNNDPCFELGNIASESHLDDDQLALLVSCYFGGPSPIMLARARLQAVMSQYGWTLWGVIQQGASDLPVDFWSWAMDKYERAAATFTSPRFDALLDAAVPP